MVSLSKGNTATTAPTSPPLYSPLTTTFDRNDSNEDEEDNNGMPVVTHKELLQLSENLLQVYAEELAVPSSPLTASSSSSPASSRNGEDVRTGKQRTSSTLLVKLKVPRDKLAKLEEAAVAAALKKAQDKEAALAKCLRTTAAAKTEAKQQELQVKQEQEEKREMQKQSRADRAKQREFRY
jgi:hypothetical protein